MKRILKFICFLPLLCFSASPKWDTQNEEEALFLNRIADFWEEGEYSIAKAQIQEFLTVYPESTFSDSLNAAIGDLLLREGSHGQALESYAKIQDPEIEKRVFLNKLQCLSAIQWYASLVDICESFLRKEQDDAQETLQVTHYLATALYQLCINSEGEKMRSLAHKARPYFEELFQSDRKHEIKEAFAHLLSLLKEHSKAASLYLELAKDGDEESLFKAALLQAEYDKELALKTLEELLETSLGPEAFYTKLALLFDLEKYETIINEKDLFLRKIPPSKLADAHLFLGRSFFSLEKYAEACLELGSYIVSQEATSPSLYGALLMLVRASEKAEDLTLLTIGLKKLEILYPEDENLFNAKLSKALLLKKQNRTEEALRELSCLEERPEVLLEEIAIYDKMGSWRKTRDLAFTFLSKYPNHKLLALAGKYLIAASTETANTFDEGKKDLISDLQNLLKKEFIPTETRLFWKYLLGKTFFVLHDYKNAESILLEATQDPLFPQESLADAYLVLGLCYRDDAKNLASFISYGEKALNAGGIDKGFLHSALYNAYLERDPEKAEEHLFQAFKEKANIEEKNLLWLSRNLIDKQKPQDAIDVLMHVKEEISSFELARAYYCLGEYEKTISLLEKLKQENEITLLLGKALAATGKKQEAKKLFDSLFTETSFLRTACGSAAYLESIRLDYGEGQKPSVETFAKLKNLILQKTISNEPTYLEAALDYINLQTKRPQDEEREEVELLLRKKLSLLQKTKKAFESKEDLLSKDYHAGRERSKKQNALYMAYMDFFEAEMLSTQSLLERNANVQTQLQAKAKSLLLKITQENVHPDLVARANQCLNP